MKKTEINLIPPARTDLTGNYFCTWTTQSHTLDKESCGDGVDLSELMRNKLNYDFLFGKDGILPNDMAKIRSDIIVLLDDGWDVPPNTGSKNSNRMGSMVLNKEKFAPLCDAENPGQSLKNLNDKIKSLGYRGTGLWVSPQIPVPDGEDYIPPSEEEFRAYWEKKARESHEGGILYWKVDWGYSCNTPSLRRIMTESVRKYAPGLWIEHALVQGPNTHTDQAVRDEQNKIIENELPFSDALRTYDVVLEFETVLTLARCAQAFRAVAKHPAEYNARQIINVEDEPYVAAALGCAGGIMRHRMESESKRKESEKGEPRFHKAIILDETTRSVLFQRIAPPFGIADSLNNISEETLTDAADFHQTGWPDLNGRYSETAPAIIARNCLLPKVIPAKGEMPFIAAMRHPNGTYAVSALPRYLDGKWSIPKAHVSMELESTSSLIGIFGEFESLSFTFPEKIDSRRILLQDPVADFAFDITNDVQCDGTTLTIPGDILHMAGLSGASKGDISRPASIMRIS